MTAARDNVDPAELAKFDSMAARWWDTEGDFKPLHDINPLRVDWIRKHVDLDGRRALDVGCGGGILSESMAAAGAVVTGIDMAEGPLSVARLHLLESGAEVDYRQTTAEELAAVEPAEYDVVTCLEMLEHVPDPAQVIRSCTELVRPAKSLPRLPRSYLRARLSKHRRDDRHLTDTNLSEDFEAMALVQ